MTDFPIFNQLSNEEIKYILRFEIGVTLKDVSGADIVKYQQWVDYDMEHYGHISQTTMDVLKEEGLTVVKDKYGDYEVIIKYKGR